MLAICNVPLADFNDCLHIKAINSAIKYMPTILWLYKALGCVKVVQDHRCFRTQIGVHDCFLRFYKFILSGFFSSYRVFAGTRMIAMFSLVWEKKINSSFMFCFFPQANIAY